MKSHLYKVFLLIFINIIASRFIDINTEGEFYSCSDSCFIIENGTVAEWAEPTINNSRSGLKIECNNTKNILVEEEINICNLTHFNNPVTGTVPQYVGMNISMNIDGNKSEIFSFMLEINETLNRQSDSDPCIYENSTEWFGKFNESTSPCCPYYTEPANPCSDRIWFITPVNIEYSIILDNLNYTLLINGFENNGSIVESFITQEQFETVGVIYGRLVIICDENTTCVSDNQCVIGDCIDDICIFNDTILNGLECITEEDLSEKDEECFVVMCYYGECVVDTNSFDGEECFDVDCGESYCKDGVCMINYFNCESEDGGDDDDNNGINLLPLLSLLSLLCCCLLCILLVIPLFFIPCIVIISKTVAESTGASISSESFAGASNNPIYEDAGEEHVNPVYE